MKKANDASHFSHLLTLGHDHLPHLYSALFSFLERHRTYLLTKLDLNWFEVFTVFIQLTVNSHT